MTRLSFFVAALFAVTALCMAAFFVTTDLTYLLSSFVFLINAVVLGRKIK